jgi:dihydroorotate dehydrogenase
MFATRFINWSYRHLAKPVFFAQDPELVHDRMTAVGEVLGRYGLTRRLTDWAFAHRHPKLEQEVLGLRFANPVGLAAGFDKNARMIPVMHAVGFGFTEVGSITGEPCAGNPKPRLWRLPKSESLGVYYGLMNDGAEAVASRLRGGRWPLVVGTSVAKTNSPDTCALDAGVADYAKAFRAFTDIGDYYTVNISCPNAFGGEPFAEPTRLEALLTELDRIETSKPILLKLAVDLEEPDLRELIAVTDRHRVHGFVLSNLSKRRDQPGLLPEELEKVPTGGLSGRPVFEPSNRQISTVYRLAGDRYKLIGVGGVFTAEHAYAKIRQGASLVQLITGMIFGGPQTIGEINHGLVRLLERDGFSSVAEAVGADHR